MILCSPSRPSPRARFPRASRSIALSACLLPLALSACGPEKKSPATPAPKDAEANTNVKASQNLEAPDVLRPIDPAQGLHDLGPKQVETPSQRRTCVSDPARNQAIVERRWLGAEGGFNFLLVDEVRNERSSRVEIWQRDTAIPCSEENWAQVGWQDAANVNNLRQKVVLNTNVSRTSGDRETITRTGGFREYVYDGAGHAYDGETLTLRRTLTIGTPAQPNDVSVRLLEDGQELRSLGGRVHTDPANPLVEIVQRRLGKENVLMEKTVLKGTLLTAQNDGTNITTTVENLVYRGREGSAFSCVPVSGKITEVIAFTDGNALTMVRTANQSGIEISTRCSPGLPWDKCALLVNQVVRKSSTPNCLY